MGDEREFTDQYRKPPPEERRESDDKDARQRAYAYRDCAASWNEYLKRDQEEANVKLTIARAFWIMATTHPSSPQYAEAAREDWSTQQQLLTLWERRRQERAI